MGSPVSIAFPCALSSHVLNMWFHSMGQSTGFMTSYAIFLSVLAYLWCGHPCRSVFYNFDLSVGIRAERKGESAPRTNHRRGNTELQRERRHHGTCRWYTRKGRSIKQLVNFNIELTSLIQSNNVESVLIHIVWKLVKTSQRAPCVEMTSNWCRCDVITLHGRHYGVMCVLE